MTEWLRLAFGTAVVLFPGWSVARALGRRGASATLAWGLAAIALSLAVTFAVGGSLTLTLALLLAIGVVALPFSRRRPRRPGARGLVFLAGLAFGGALWFVEGPVGGDGLFHLARVRKLLDFDDLSLRAVDEFRDGGLHPGYAFPLWHGFLALVAEVAAVDPAVVVRHEPSLLAPLAFLVAYEAGLAVFGSVWGGVAVLVGQVALYGLAAGHGGAYVVLTNPGTAVRQLLVPAGFALFFAALVERRWRGYATLAALALCAALVHPAFASFMLLPLAGYAVARLALVRGEARETGTALAAAALPIAAVLAWLRPLVAQTASHTPKASDLQRAFVQYRDQLDVFSSGSYRLDPSVLGRGGAVAVAALLSVPLAIVAPRRRWAAFVLGGSVLVLLLALVPWLFAHFSDVVSLSQSRRAAGFLPFPFAFAGGAYALALVLGPLAVPAGLLAGVAFQLLWPGDFGGKTLEHGGPALAAWTALVGGALALAIGLSGRPRLEERRGLLAALAAGLFVVPVAVHAAVNWSAPARQGAGELTPGLVRAIREQVPKRAVVWSDRQTDYRLAAYAPVYIGVAPPTHVANTPANRPYGRSKDERRWMKTGDLSIPRGYGATWIVVDQQGPLKSLPLEPVYRDARYALYRLVSPK